MADNILRLNVESSEYDAKLKKAAEGIRHLAEVAHKSGGELTGLEQSELDYIKALGEMETKSRSAAGSTRELESVYKELKVIYDQLNDVEKADEGGKALAASLEQIKQRAQESKAQLESASKSLQENSNAGQQDSSVLEQLASKFTLNIDALKLFDYGLSAAKAALDVAKDAFMASEANVDEWGRTIQSAQSLYEGFLTAINNGDISGYLSRMDKIVQAAREAYNALDTLQTMRTIQSPGMSRQQTENERIRSMIQTGRYIAPHDGRSNAVWQGKQMKEGQLLTADQIKMLERQLQNGMKKVTSLVENEVKQSGVAIEAYYNSLAQQNGMSLQEFKKGTSTWEEFSQKIKGYEEYRKWDREARAEFARQGGRGNVDFDKSNPYAEYRKWGTFRVDKMGENSYNDLVALIKQRDQQTSQIYSILSQSYRTMNRAEGVTVRSIMGGGTGGKGGKTDNTDDFTEIVGLIGNAQERVKNLQKQISESWDNNEIARLRTELKSAQNELDVLQGKLPKDTVAEITIKADDTEALQKLESIEGVSIDPKTMTVTANTSEALLKVQEMTNKLNGTIVTVKVVAQVTDEDIERSLREQYGKPIEVPVTPTMTPGQQMEQEIRINFAEQSMEADLQTLRTLLQTQIENGIEGVDIPSDLIIQKILGDGLNIPDKYWKDLQEQINEKLKEQGKEPINIDMSTGKKGTGGEKKNPTVQALEKFNGDFSQITGGIGSIASGIQQLGIELPQGIQDALGVLTGISSIITGITSILSLILIAEQSTAAASWTDAIIPFAHGGIVPKFANGGLIGKAAGGMLIPGNSMSGDRLRMPVDGGRGFIGVNSGELILNASSQMNIADDLLSAQALVKSIGEQRNMMSRAQQGGTVSQLAGTSMQNIQLEAIVTAEQLKLVQNNRGKRTGRGEVVYSKRAR